MRFLTLLLSLTLTTTPLLAQNYRLPDLGDASDEMMTPAAERRLGDQVIRQLRAQGVYMNDPEVNDYLDTLGHRLVAASPDATQPFEFFAINDKTVNAFALPGGYIGVNTGLILLTQTESELASVLAHEVTHVTQHHLARMMAGQKDMLLVTLAALAAALAAAAASSNAQMGAAAVAGSQALAMQSQINYTREHEYESDRLGFQLLSRAGFDTGGMASFMQRLLRANRFADGSLPSYLRTHPITTERIAEANARSADAPYRQVVDSLDFHLVRALLQSYEGTPKEALAAFQNALKEKKYNNETAVHYGIAAAAIRLPDFALAKQQIAWLDARVHHPMIDAMAGHILLESGDLNGAITRFHDALQKYPNKKQLVYDYPQALLKAGRAAEAAAFLEQAISRFPNDGLLHQLASRAYAQAKRPFKEHQHLGEYYAWAGAYRVAAEQFEIALKQKNVNFQDMSAVESRLREVRQMK
jgi:predicted Zn-dependent protease